MSILTGNYVKARVGQEDKNFVMARKISTSDFRSGWDQLVVGEVQNQTAKTIYFQMNETKATSAKDLLMSIGIDKEYDVHGRVPKYKPVLSSGYQLGDTELIFRPIPVGQEPSNWLELLEGGFIYTSTIDDLQDPVAKDKGSWRNVPFDGNHNDFNNYEQYYICEDAGAYFRIMDEGDTTGRPKFLRFFLGRGPLSSDSGRISENILVTYTGTSQLIDRSGWWTFEQVNLQGEIVISPMQPTSWTSGRSYNSTVGTTSNFSYIQIGNANLNGYRNLGSQQTYYQSNWKPDITEQQKSDWKHLCVEKVEIQNVTITQFGTLTHDGHEYFGVWVLEPTIKNYIGYNRIPAEDNEIATIPQGDRWSDLRDYGNFTDPVERGYDNLHSVTFYGIEISELDFELPLEDGTAPPPKNDTPKQGRDWPELNPVVLQGRSLGTFASSSENGYHIYCMHDITYKSLLSMIWNWSDIPANIIEEFTENGSFNPLSLLNPWGNIFQGVASAAWQSRVDPMAAIMFSRKLPKYVANQVVAQNDFGPIKIAGINTGLTAACVQDDVYATSITIDCSSLATTDSYLDLSPYTTAEIYIPYIGVVQLDPSDFMGGEINIYFNCAPSSGVISAHIVCWNDLFGNGKFKTEYGPYEGDAGYNLPVAQKDANAFQRELGYMKAIGTAMSGPIAAVGNSFRTLANNPNEQSIMKAGFQNVGITAAASGLGVKKAVDSFLMKQAFHGTQIGSQSAVVTPTSDIYLIVSTPLPVHTSFEECKRYGLTSGKLSTVTAARTEGKKELVAWKYIDLTGVQATEAELDAINRYMIGGVYI